MKNYAKKLIAMSASLVMSLTFTASVCAADITVKLGGKPIEFDQPPVIEDGRTLVPVRKIFEALGADVSWDEETKTVTTNKGTKTVVLVIDSTEANAGDETIILDVPARIINGRTLVPVRFIADSFGVRVSWNNSERCVYLSTGLTDAGSNSFATALPQGNVMVEY